jgi:SAM-dependent methyltransferase
LVLGENAAGQLAAFAPILRCPRCKSLIVFAGEACRCSSAECVFSRGQGFPKVHDQPILVDGETSAISPESLTRTLGASPIRRRTPGFADRLLDALRLNSAHQSRRNCAAFLSKLDSTTQKRPLILVIGGGARGAGVEAFYALGAHSLLCFDIYASLDTQFIADAHTIPLNDCTVDGVWIQAVLEHVVEPTQVASEIWRVLKPGGLVYSEIPFMQQVHEGAYDFTRFTLSGHRYLFKGFEVIDAGVTGGAGTQLLWAIDHFVRAVTRSRSLGKAAKLAFLWLTWFDLVSSRAHSQDAASGTYVLGRKAAGAITHRDVVQFYSGAGR